MCKRFEDWSSQIEKYCSENGLSFEKAKKLSKSWGIDDLMLLHYDPEKGKMGLRDETPMPLALYIKKGVDGALIFEQTEHTRKYLA